MVKLFLNVWYCLYSTLFIDDYGAWTPSLLLILSIHLYDKVLTSYLATGPLPTLMYSAAVAVSIFSSRLQTKPTVSDCVTLMTVITDYLALLLCL